MNILGSEYERIVAANENVVERLGLIEEWLKENDLDGRLAQTLKGSLQVLQNLGDNCASTVWLMMDFAPMSFTFKGGGLYGGLIFHGAWRGEAPTFSVCLEETHGWSLHT